MSRKLVSFATQGVVQGIEVAVADAIRDTQQLIDLQDGKIEGKVYSRRGDPSNHQVEERLAELEHAENVLLFSSGMAAIHSTLSAILKAGQHILVLDEGNVTIRSFFETIMPNNGVYVTNIPFKEFSNLRSYIRDNTTALFLEIPANPFLRVVDLSSAVSVAKESGITTIVDSTFASPLNIKPLDFGADLVLHSGTKYLGGHHDLSTGVVAGSYERLSLINRYRNLLGSNVRPLDSFLLSRSLYTFEMTMQCRNKSALEIARYLEKHPKIKRVWYPGCKSHPDYELAKAQMVGFGGVIPFELNANEEQTRIFVDSLSIPYLAHNFGGCTSTVEPHVLFTHYGNREEAQRRGLGGNLIRYSVGFEKASDLIADLENTLKSF